MGPSGSMATIPGRGNPDHGCRVGSNIGGFLNPPPWAAGYRYGYMPPIMAAGQFSRHMGRAVAVQPARPRHVVCSTLSLSVQLLQSHSLILHNSIRTLSCSNDLLANGAANSPPMSGLTVLGEEWQGWGEAGKCFGKRRQGLRPCCVGHGRRILHSARAIGMGNHIEFGLVRLVH